MTKRFTYEKHKVKDNLTGEFHSSNMVSVNVLNEIYDENQRLNDENQRIKELFLVMLRQTNVEINPEDQTIYSATLIFNMEQYLTIRKMMKE